MHKKEQSKINKEIISINNNISELYKLNKTKKDNLTNEINLLNNKHDKLILKIKILESLIENILNNISD